MLASTRNCCEQSVGLPNYCGGISVYWDVLYLLVVGSLAIVVTAQLWSAFADPSMRWRLLFSRRGSFLIATAIWTVYLLIVSAVISSGSVILNAANHVPNTLMMIGISGIGLMGFLKGTAPRCAKCRYSLEGLGEESGSVAGGGGGAHVCPECGSAWNEKSGVVRGDPVINVRQIVVSSVLMLIGIGTMISSLVWHASLATKVILPLASNSMLIGHVTRSNTFVMYEWDELRKRTLTASESDALALGLLTRKPLSLHAWSDATKWLIAEANAGRLTAEAHRAMVARFVSPAVTSNGSSVEIWSTTNQAWGLAGAFASVDLWLVVGQPVAGGRPVRASAALGTPPASATTPTPVQLTPDVLAPGAATATLWVIAMPKGTTAVSVAWNPDGTPSVSGAVWVESIEAKR